MGRNAELHERLLELRAEVRSLKQDFGFVDLRSIFLHYDPDVFTFISDVDGMEMNLTRLIEKVRPNSSEPEGLVGVGEWKRFGGIDG